ncbi:N-acetylglucosamine-specific PTS transporter subunit IIBC [Halanaerobacter jeridensis]|uniref:PTS system N-acetylglucosamine-specific IIC component n=1 Tax=Halanaerobacter jeridensis TaxID=706427 RepID=A0A938XVC5_9FIRM|nr:N-acetylglucosamine-specific PTS transporter subunit IIBC [Halanaerobacter jeridensis]MBM7558213.1 PTS system N-acetylglucosamine-specific IIC component [Halanaerobacter jeridensis]
MKKKIVSQVQRIGKALMLPIAVLPAAALLLRLGAGDVLDISFVEAAGSAIFSNLALLFGIGVAIGISFDGSGASGLAGAVGYFVITEGTQAINEDINMGVLAGIIAGVVAGALYNRFHDIDLPDYLGFFAGKRFVPIVTGATCVLLAGIFGYAWPPIQAAIEAVGSWIIGAGALGVFVYGVLNRALIPLGLHHVMNSFIWFVFGEYTNEAGKVVTGDLSRFFAGDPNAGSFMAGFYPIMMFGLPAAALAMYHTAKDEHQKEVSGVLFSIAFTSFLTGITEPLEFSFMFLAPFLYVIHSLLSGVSMAVTYIFGIKHGFGFSAGAIDYVLNYGLATKPILLIPMGIVTFAIYYFLFKFAIQKFDLPTPGRVGANEIDNDMSVMPDEGESQDNSVSGSGNKAQKYIEYLGGENNLEEVESCVTRLRLSVKDTNKLNEAGLKKLGASGIIKLDEETVQVVVGTKAEKIAIAINKELK